MEKLITTCRTEGQYYHPGPKHIDFALTFPDEEPKGRANIIIQLACDGASYLPTKRAEKGGHYSAYISSGVTGHQGGDLLVRKILDLLNEMWEG